MEVTLQTKKNLDVIKVRVVEDVERDLQTS